MDNTSTTSSTAGEWIVQPGTDVYGTDDKKIGSVDDIQGEHLVVHKGFFFPKDHYIPFSAIASHTDDRINLNVSADEASNMDWDQVPATTTTATTTGSGYATNDYDATSVPGTTGATDTYASGTAGTVVTGTTDSYATDTTTRTGHETDTAAGTESAPFEHRTAGTVVHSDDTDDIRVPVVEEELSATKRGVERGAVRVETNVTEREETLNVPVTEERVHVERRAVDRPADAADISAEGGVIDVPVYGEEVDMAKRARVVEEVEISKDAVQETRNVSGTVRREDVEVVDGTTDVTTDSTTTDTNRRRS